jgi:predicted dehydrogenase
LFIECHRLAPFKVRSTEVDVVLDLMIHDLDVVLSLVRSEPTVVSAVGSPVLTKKLDIANARIEFASGAVANLTSSRVSQNTQRKFRIFQPDQYVSIDFQAGEVNILTKTGEWSEGDIPLDHQTHSLEKGDALLEETRSFIDAIRADRPVTVSGRDGLKALHLAEKIIEDALRRLS